MQNLKTLTTGDIANYCGVNLRTVIRWIDKGLLTAFKLPGRGNNRVTQEDFVQFLHHNNMPVPEELLTSAPPVLIVDDEPQLAKAIQRVIKQQGFESEIANDGFKAGSLLLKNKPALMTLDLQMPGINGFDIVEYARNELQLTNLKILVISAMPDSHVNQALTLGADMSLSKPFNNQLLANTVKELMPKSLHRNQ